MNTVQIKERIGYATSKKDLKGWSKGDKKDVFVAKMCNGRFSIYKSARHFREDSGYRTYDSIQDLEKDFFIENIQEAVS